MPAARRTECYWLFRTEPHVYGIEDLERDGRTEWGGVRNYQARNLLRDEVKVGDGVLIYHSQAEPLAIVGEARVVVAGHPDETAFDPDSEYFDLKSTREKPTWYSVTIEFVRRFESPLPRGTLASVPDLADMLVLQRGSRLSIQPVSARQWRAVHRELGLKPA
ncbi:MAG: EVE domain-containing protein [Planctomycetota bacterium]